MEFPLFGYGKLRIFHAGDAVFADSTSSRSATDRLRSDPRPDSPGFGPWLDSSRVRRAAPEQIPFFVPSSPACVTLAGLPTGGRSGPRGAERTAAGKHGTAQTPLHRQRLSRTRGVAYSPLHAGVVKQVNTRDLKSLGFGLAGSSPAARTKSIRHEFRPFRAILRSRVVSSGDAGSLQRAGCSLGRTRGGNAASNDRTGLRCDDPGRFSDGRSRGMQVLRAARRPADLDAPRSSSVGESPQASRPGGAATSRFALSNRRTRRGCRNPWISADIPALRPSRRRYDRRGHDGSSSCVPPGWRCSRPSATAARPVVAETPAAGRVAKPFPATCRP